MVLLTLPNYQIALLQKTLVYQEVLEHLEAANRKLSKGSFVKALYYFFYAIIIKD
jgi:hypothetical protein